MRVPIVPLAETIQTVVCTNKALVMHTCIHTCGERIRIDAPFVIAYARSERRVSVAIPPTAKPNEEKSLPQHLL